LLCLEPKVGLEAGIKVDRMGSDAEAENLYDQSVSGIE
jgi:hypothetical protein